MKKNKIFITIAALVTLILPLIHIVIRGIYYLGDFYATQAQTAQGKEQSLLNDKAYECFKFVENANGIIWVTVIFFLLFLGVLLIFDRISFKSYACLILVFIASSFLYLKCLDIAVVGMAKTNSWARVIMLLRNARFWILIALTIILYAILKLYKAKKERRL